MDVGQINTSLIYDRSGGSFNNAEKEKLKLRVSQLGIAAILNPADNYNTYSDMHFSKMHDSIQMAMLEKAKNLKKPFFKADREDVRKAIDFLILVAWHAKIVAPTSEKTELWMLDSIQRLEYLNDHMIQKKENEVTSNKALKKLDNLFETLSPTEKTALVKKVKVAKKIISDYFK